MKTSSFDMVRNPFGALLDGVASFKVQDAALCPDLSDNMRFVLGYFADKRQGRAFNRRADLVPSAMARLLPRITILDAVYDTDGRFTDASYRLMGTDIAGLYGEATGKMISSYHDGAALARVREIASHCIETGRPALGESIGLSGGKPFLTVRVLYIPFSEDGETISQFFIYSGIRRRIPDTV
ncbi:MAG: PAS domain-containing protein [Alphaproteobacteria bacterium]|nr:MAG: PAS domain-containing protein [Alphaproteobacteria bacterium]